MSKTGPDNTAGSEENLNPNEVDKKATDRAAEKDKVKEDTKKNMEDLVKSFGIDKIFTNLINDLAKILKDLAGEIEKGGAAVAAQVGIKATPDKAIPTPLKQDRNITVLKDTSSLTGAMKTLTKDNSDTNKSNLANQMKAYGDTKKIIGTPEDLQKITEFNKKFKNDNEVQKSFTNKEFIPFKLPTDPSSLQIDKLNSILDYAKTEKVTFTGPDSEVMALMAYLNKNPRETIEAAIRATGLKKESIEPYIAVINKWNPNIPAEATPASPEKPNELSKFNDIISKYAGEVFKSKGNGGREVGIFRSGNFDPNQPATVVFHLHGTNGQEAGTGDGKTRIESLLGALNNTSENVVIVYPLSVGARGPKSSTALERGYDYDWFKPGTNESMTAMKDEVFKKLNFAGNNQVTTVLQGHSAGGIAIKNAVTGGFKPDRVRFLDSSYGDWATNTYEAIKANPKVQLEVFYKKGSNTENSAQKLAGKPGVRLIPSDTLHGDFNSKYGIPKAGKDNS